MRYDVRADNGDRFVLEQDEIEEGAYVRNAGVTYRVRAVRLLAPHESDEFDAVVDVAWAMGPANAEFIR